MRPAWLATIFLALISCFDEQLVEDRNVNRFEDSVVCSSPQLSQTASIFMNKCDLLEKKIKSGVSVKKSLPSFEDRPNGTASVAKYLRFLLVRDGILREHLRHSNFV
ncbi:hypothetical protein PILCRDRAFT_662670 [Piloderma croceum F 1598]|uniref:Uncharacterized protein n=1 Tax=Piloderma croceum (strain F 1598) TaxID=765440 RepID=A0A0C3ETK4_PILCF|nr:hypothetical protein PILCRDRAFT_662670 [Piloderma croceum F 1598]